MNDISECKALHETGARKDTNAILHVNVLTATEEPEDHRAGFIVSGAEQAVEALIQHEPRRRVAAKPRQSDRASRAWP